LDHYAERIWKSREDQRSPYQKDRDRILYSSAFRRLAGVTQVVSPGEGHIFHSRLSHTLEVAQIARRLAERLLVDFPSESAALDNINADVTESAALAHDLGHPPFGHVAEKELDRLVRDKGCLPDGFEGNAQSFRAVTKLCVRQDWSEDDANTTIEPKRGDYGINLTRGTLNAILKYPWLWAPEDKKSRKWGVYDTEREEFEWVRKGELREDCQTIEAAIMDWADDIAYSLHDTEDFYRAGLIPFDRLVLYETERKSFLRKVFKRFADDRRPKSQAQIDRLSDAFHAFCSESPANEPYTGTPRQRWALRSFSANKIGQFITATRLTRDPENPLAIPQNLKDQVEIVKQLVWQFVIVNPELATLQLGYVTIIRGLFDIFMDAANRGPDGWKIFPARFRFVLEDWRDVYGGDLPKTRTVRNVVDTIANFSDSEAIAMFKRLTGISSGSLRDLLPS